MNETGPERTAEGHVSLVVGKEDMRPEYNRNQEMLGAKDTQERGKCY